MASFGDKLKSYRLAHHMSQDALATIVKSTKQQLSLYETGKRVPKIDVVKAFADALHLPITALAPDYETAEAYLAEKQYGNVRAVSMVQLPVIGDIAAGLPKYNTPDAEPESMSVPVDVVGKADILLHVSGHSMEPEYRDGDYALIHLQDTVDDGEIAAVVFVEDGDDGSSATLKKVYRQSWGLSLVSLNPDFPPQVYMGEDAEHIRILGKAVGLLRWSA